MRIKWLCSDYRIYLTKIALKENFFGIFVNMKEKKSPEQTPMLKQYFEIKARYPDTILLYRVGDFYETFGEDAIKTSKILGIVLTRKASGNGTFTELAGIPHHAIDNYLPKLVSAGMKVAVCDQLEDPKLAKKIVRRGVTELVTPGVAYNDNLLPSGENNYLAAVCFESKKAGIAFLDISTGTFKAAQGTFEYIDLLLGTMAPKEILVERSFLEGFRQRFAIRCCLSPLDEWTFAYESGKKKLCTQLGVDTLKGFGVEKMDLGISAAGAILNYLEMTEHNALGHIRSISRIDESEFVWMDRFTYRNLEIFNSLAGSDGKSLIDVLNRCCSPMGVRTLREWLAMPLKDKEKINGRYDVVDAFLGNAPLRDSVRAELSNIGDLERIVAKAAAGRMLPREALQLARALKSTASIRTLLSEDDLLLRYAEKLDDCSALFNDISSTILPESAAALGKGDVIANGVSEELDELRNTLRNGIVITGGSAAIPNLSTYLKELSGYNIRIGYPRQKFSFMGCPEVTETSAVASVGMIMAAKDDQYINCLSEAPVMKVERKEEPAAEEVIAAPETEPGTEYGTEPETVTEPQWAPEQEPLQTEPAAKEPVIEEPEPVRVKTEKKAKEPRKKGPIIKWTNPFDNFTKKMSDRIGKIIDNGYDGMED